MPKNVKSEDKERNQIEPRANHPVEFQDEALGDANALFNNKIASFHPVINSSTNIPSGGKENSVILGIRQKRTGGSNDGYQLYFQEQGKLWYRRAKSSNNRWREITFADDVILKPESSSSVSDINDSNLKSGIYRTRAESTETRNFPNQITDQASKWGILQHYTENVNTGMQMYTPIDGQQFGKIYVRTYNDAGSSERRRASKNWKELDIHGILSLRDNIFLHPSDSAVIDVNTKTDTGYYTTSQLTTLTGLPDQLTDEESQNGILKVLKHGNHVTQYYNPSQGNHKNEIFIRTWDTTLRSTPKWDVLTGDKGHVRVADDRGLSTPTKPHEYRERSETHYDQNSSGYVFYEWLYTGNLGNTPEGKSIRCTCMTIVPYDKSINPDQGDSHTQASHDWTDINQTIYCTDGSVYFRTAKTRDEWNKWNKLSGNADNNKVIKMPEWETQLTQGINDLSYSGIFRTTQSTQNLPNGANNKDGFLTYYRMDNNNGLQYWSAIAGNYKDKSFVRTKSAGTWSTHWTELGAGGGGSISGITQQQADQRYIQLPSVSGNRMQNANNHPSRDGVYKVDKDDGNINYPVNNWGIVEYYYQNYGNKTGFQRFTSAEGTHKGKSWVRGFESGTFGSWKEITASGSGVTEDRVITLATEVFNRLIDDRLRRIMDSFKAELKKIFEHFHK